MAQTTKRRLILALLAVYAGPVSAQSAIPTRQVTTIASTDSGVIANVYVLHPRSDGRVLVNDAARHRLVLLDPGLKTYKLVADTAGEAPNKFGTGAGGLLGFPGDSAAFIDRAGSALVIVDHSGNFGRVTTPLQQQDFTFLAGSAYGVPGFDALGRLYYRSGFMGGGLPSVNTNVPDTTLFSADSAPVLRADLEKRRLDTVAMMKVPVSGMRVHVGPNGVSLKRIINPIPSTDEWAYFPDGTVAVIRGGDYHLDWFFPDGARKSTPKMPFAWRRLTDAEKQRMVDSVQHTFDSTAAAAAARAAQSAAAAGKPAPAPAQSNVEVVPASALPDYVPAVRIASQMRVDLNGNLWIMPGSSVQTQGGTTFDVVNRKGEIVERVQLPAGRNLHGFGPGDIVYMSVPSSVGWPRVEKGKIVRP